MAPPPRVAPSAKSCGVHLARRALLEVYGLTLSPASGGKRRSRPGGGGGGGGGRGAAASTARRVWRRLPGGAAVAAPAGLERPHAEACALLNASGRAVCLATHDSPTFASPRVVT